jgi:regulator of cell morphogenesis and NO signaling
MSTITLDRTVADLAVENLDRTRVFERLGLDYCCKGKVPFGEACLAQGLDPQEVAAQLAAADAAAAPTTADLLAQANAAELARNILTQHHAYLWDELPRLLELHAHVTDHHGKQQPMLVQSLILFTELQAALMSHMCSEERYLIPISEQDGTNASGELPEGLSRELAAHEHEHEEVGELLYKLRQLHNDYQAPATACRKQRALLSRLAELEQDTHLHVLKENQLLFPLLRRAGLEMV